MQPWWAEETYFKNKLLTPKWLNHKTCLSRVFSVVYLRLDVKSRPECVRRAREDMNKSSQSSCSGGFSITCIYEITGFRRSPSFIYSDTQTPGHTADDDSLAKYMNVQVCTRRVNEHRHYKMQHLSRIRLARLFLFFFPFFSLLSSIFLARISLIRSKKTCNNQDSTASWRTDHFHSILNRSYYQFIWS